jgi:hypothetical protein
VFREVNRVTEVGGVVVIRELREVGEVGEARKVYEVGDMLKLGK